MSPLHSPFPSTSPAVVLAPWDPTAGPTLNQTRTLAGDGALRGDGKRSRCRSSGQEQCCRDGLKPSKMCPIHTPAAPHPQGCPCLPWLQWGEQGRETQGSWFWGARLDTTLQDLNWGVGRAPSPLCPGKTLPLLGDPGRCGARGWQEGWGRWGRGDQRAAAAREGLRHRASRREPISPQQGPLSAANPPSGPRGDLQPFPSTYPTALPLRPTSMLPRRCRNNRLTKSYF